MRLFPLAAVLLGVASGPTHADSLRCGDRIVGEEASAAEVLSACGKPDYKDVWHGSAHEEEWTYNFGPQLLLRILHFRNGHVTQIDADGYGFANDPAKQCSPTDLEDGMTKYRLLSRCGPPLTQESYSGYAPIRRPDGRIVGRGLASVHREKWTYDFGPQYFMQTVTFENGRLSEVSSGQRGVRRP
jgi:hypothetical protein